METTGRMRGSASRPPGSCGFVISGCHVWPSILFLLRLHHATTNPNRPKAESKQQTTREDTGRREEDRDPRPRQRHHATPSPLLRTASRYKQISPPRCADRPSSPPLPRLVPSLRSSSFRAPFLFMVLDGCRPGPHVLLRWRVGFIDFFIFLKWKVLQLQEGSWSAGFWAPGAPAPSKSWGRRPGPRRECPSVPSPLVISFCDRLQLGLGSYRGTN